MARTMEKMPFHLRDYIDEFIAEECSSIGDTFRAAAVDEWRDRKGYEFDVSVALTQHRQSPAKRVFTTERVGMGPKAYYRVVEVSDGYDRDALLRMHKQQGQEMVDRWMKEYRYRMFGMGTLSPAGKRTLTRAKRQVQLVAEVMHAEFEEMDSAA